MYIRATSWGAEDPSRGLRGNGGGQLLSFLHPREGVLLRLLARPPTPTSASLAHAWSSTRCKAKSMSPAKRPPHRGSLWTPGHPKPCARADGPESPDSPVGQLRRGEVRGSQRRIHAQQRRKATRDIIGEGCRCLLNARRPSHCSAQGRQHRSSWHSQGDEDAQGWQHEPLPSHCLRGGHGFHIAGSLESRTEAPPHKSFGARGRNRGGAQRREGSQNGW